MSFNVTKRIGGDRALAALTDAVNEQLATAPEAEHETIRNIADATAKFIGDADSDHVVEINIGGAITDNTRALSLSTTVTQLRPKPAANAPTAARWEPPVAAPASAPVEAASPAPTPTG